jgi:hypothetical protein
MRVVGEVEARLGVSGAADGIYPKRTNLPIGRNGSNQEEEADQPGKEEQKAELPAAAALLRLLCRWRLLCTPEWDSHPAHQASAVRLRRLFRGGQVASSACNRTIAVGKPVGREGERLAGRPAHASPAEQMEVQMINTLPCLRTLVHHQPVAFAVDLALVRHAIRYRKKPAQQDGMFACDLMHRRNVLFWNDQHMGGGNRTDVFERHDIVVAINLLG